MNGTLTVYYFDILKYLYKRSPWWDSNIYNSNLNIKLICVHSNLAFPDVFIDVQMYLGELSAESVTLRILILIDLPFLAHNVGKSYMRGQPNTQKKRFHLSWQKEGTLKVHSKVLLISFLEVSGFEVFLCNNCKILYSKEHSLIFN